MSDEADIKAAHEREAARVNLRKMLDRKGRGDRITAAEIADSTGFAEWQSFGDTVRRWAKAAKFSLQPVINDGWRIGLARDHIDAAESKRKRGLRAVKDEVRLLMHTPQSELTDAEQRRHQFAISRAADRLQSAEKHERETRQEFKLGGDRVPLRALAGGK